MAIPSRPIGQDPQSQQLWNISKQLERFAGILSQGGGGGGGGASLISVTYSALYNLADNALLVPNQAYLINDYATVHYITADGNILDPVPNIGVTEPLIVIANTISTLDKEARSALYPLDIIYYDWNPGNWYEDASFVDTGTLVPGFKGVIYFRHDTILDNYMGYDFRNVKFRRYKTAAPTYNPLTSYTLQDKVQDATGVYYSLTAANLGNALSDQDYWCQIISFNTTEYWNYDHYVNGIPSSLEFIDCLTFVEGTGSGTYELSVRSNHFESFKDNTNYEETDTLTILSNNVFFIGNDPQYFTIYANSIGAENFNNTAAGDFYKNTIATYFYNNIINYNFLHNTIGYDFAHNITGDSFNINNIGSRFSYNVISKNFQINHIGNNYQNNHIDKDFDNNIIGNDFNTNTIGSNFEDNLIGCNFSNNITANNFNSNNISNNFVDNIVGSSFASNCISDSFTANNIGSGFGNNGIGSNFTNCTIYNGFIYNTLMDNFNGVGIDFSSSTHIYAAYNCTLFTASDTSKKLSYCDGTIFQIVAVNS